jgi:DNA repair protein RecN (Recombination protein N)
LGSRAERELIRTGRDFCEVEALITDEAGEEVLLHRHYTLNGKNTCKINGRTVTVAMLKETAARLVDVHGQHEHQSLLDVNRHILCLDRLCGDGLGSVLDELNIKLKQRKDLLAEIRRITEYGGAERLELYRAQIAEIEKARLDTDEEAALTERRRLAKASERLTDASAAADGCLTAENGALDMIGASLPYLAVIGGIDPRFEGVSERIHMLYDRFRDVCADASHYFANVESGADNLDDIEHRLDLIHRLKKKFAKGAASTVSDILSYLDGVKSKVSLIENGAEMLESLNGRRKKLEREIAASCAVASKIRRQAASAVTQAVTDSLRDLGMAQATLEIGFERKNEFTPLGFDKVEFMFSANKGEPVKPLSKIASGGEMSRVMLALKTVLASADGMGTYIFDEIDAGVSGRTAHMVAEKMAALAKNRQILCVTHLPQIAAMADEHYMITKRTDGDKTYTSVSPLDGEGAVGELARLIGGAEITETTLKSAGEMKRMAKGAR